MARAARLFPVAALLALSWGGMAGAAPGRTAGAASNVDIVGTWALVSTRQTLADGSSRPDPDLGAHPSGYMMYDRAGRMCTVFNNTARPRWGSPTPTDDEARAAVAGMVVYCARYWLDAAGGAILFDLEISLSPNVVGTSRARRFEIVGDTLTLYPTPLPAGVVKWSVTLERVAP